MNSTKANIHTDIKGNGWVEDFLPVRALPYAYLMRLDRPIGTWLLLLPGWWAIILAAGGLSGVDGYIFFQFVLFGIGAVVMRGAGCIINDLWDRNLDKEVERTSVRPLASGEIKPWQATVFMVTLLVIGLIILVQMPLVTILLGLFVFPLIILYPLMKRLVWWPQFFLGITFNFGALMGWAAVNAVISPESLLLYVGGIFWTLGYDTIYANQDKEDDARIGIKSTALRFGENSKNYVTVFYVMAMILFFSAFITAEAGLLSYLLLFLAALHLLRQTKIWDMDDPENSLEVFKSNKMFGFFMLLAALFQ